MNMTSRTILFCLIAAQTWAQAPADKSVEFAPEIVIKPKPSTERSSKTDEYPVPLWFEVIGEGVTMEPLKLEYDLESSQGRTLQMGSMSMNRGNFRAALLPANRLDGRLFKVLPKAAEKDKVFLFQWPEGFLADGLLEVISRSGKVLWTYDVDKRKKEYWASQLALWKQVLKQSGYKDDEIDGLPFMQYQFGIRDAENQDLPFWNVNESFRFCLSRAGKESGQTRLCSHFYETVKSPQGNVSILPLAQALAPPRVIALNRSAPLRQSLAVTYGKPVQFYAETADGLSYEFFSTPKKLNVVEMTEEGEEQSVNLVAEGATPIAPYDVLRDKEFSELTEFFGWEQTIGDFRVFWRTKLERSSPMILIQGEGGGAFLQRFVITKLPREALRPYLDRRTVRGTYVDGVKMFGKKPANMKLSSKQNSVSVDRDTPTEFTWRFGATERGKINKSYITVQSGQETFKAYTDVYKGYPRDVSIRLTGVAGSSGNYLLISELAANYWFEDIFGWTQYHLARQRWGVSAKVFRSMTDLKISDYSGTLSTNTADLKYRVNPGLWGRDETWGAQLSYQQVDFNIFQGKMVGAGVFWARSMPKVFDDIFNLFPWLRYPKWVDFEFIYYASAMNKEISLRGPQDGGAGNWALNFHGQVMWTDEFFGEAGFGIKNYDFIRNFDSGTVRRLGFSFASLYGTAGIGYRF